MSLAASLPTRWQARVPRRVTRRARRVGKKRFSSFGGTRRPPLSRASSSSPGEADASGEADAPASAPAPSRFFAGVGVGDCTGPMDGVGMMGYARLSQISTGLRQRQKARAFVVAETRPTFLRRRDVASESKRDEFVDEDDFDDDDHHHHVQKRTKNALVALVVVDACMVFPDLKPAVLRRVAEKVAESSFGAEYPELDAEGVFDEANVCVCASHTHSAP